jgi:hypothetical protein
MLAPANKPDFYPKIGLPESSRDKLFTIERERSTEEITIRS